MDDDLIDFALEYSEQDPVQISKFKEYQSRQQAFNGLWLLSGLISISLYLGEYIVVGWLPSPYNRAIIFSVPILAFVLSRIISRGKDRLGTSYDEVTLYEIAKSIQAYNSGDYSSVISHLGELKESITSHGNNVFPERTEKRIKNYYKKYRKKIEKTRSIALLNHL